MSVEIPVGFGLVAVRITIPGDPEPMFVTHGVDLSGAGSDHQATANAIGNDFTAAGSLATAMAGSAKVEAVILRVGGPGGTSSVYEDPVNFVCASGNIVPQNCAFLFQKQTNVAGRRGKGRMYLPAVSEVGVDNVGNLTTADITSLNTFGFNYLNFLASDAVTPSPMVLLHSTTPNSAAPAPTPVNALIASPRIATQRRRLRR